MAGCVAPKPIPIAYNCPIIQLPPDPEIITRQLTDASRPDEVMKAWVATASSYYQWNRIVHQEIENAG